MKQTDNAAVLDVSILVRDATWTKEIPFIETICHDAAQAAFKAARGRAGNADFCEACVVLADDDFAADLNYRYRDRSGPTNVLSFATLDDLDDVDDEAGTSSQRGLADGMPLLLGDVVIAFGVVVREAADMNISLVNHLRHMVVHGILHLLGYDHMEEGDAVEMEGLETWILDQLGVDDPYGDGPHI